MPFDNKTVDFKWPNIILIEKISAKFSNLDIACPLTDNNRKTEQVKKQNTKTGGQLLVSSKSLEKYLEKITIPISVILQLQKTTILQTCHIVLCDTCNVFRNDDSS